MEQTRQAQSRDCPLYTCSRPYPCRWPTPGIGSHRLCKWCKWRRGLQRHTPAEQLQHSFAWNLRGRSNFRLSPPNRNRQYFSWGPNAGTQGAPLYLYRNAPLLPLLRSVSRPPRPRRAELSQKLHNGVLVLFGHTEKGEANIRTGFFQESNFYYLTGWQEPGAILLVTPPQDDKQIGRA